MAKNPVKQAVATAEAAESNWREEAAKLADIVAHWRADEPIYSQKLLVIEANFTKLSMVGQDPAAEGRKLTKEPTERAEEARHADVRLRELVKKQANEFQRGDLVAAYVQQRQRAREIAGILVEALAPLVEMGKTDKVETATWNQFVDGLHAKVAGPALPRVTSIGISLPSVNLGEFARSDDLLGLLRQLHNNLR